MNTKDNDNCVFPLKMCFSPGSLPSGIAKITTMKKLNLAYQGFTAIGGEVETMNDLESLTLTFNLMLETVSPALSQLPLKGKATSFLFVTSSYMSFLH